MEELPLEPLRCPKCHALVVDRRSPTCTTCREALPAEWVMKPAQVAKIMEIDRECRAEHDEAMKALRRPSSSTELQSGGFGLL